MALFYWAAEVFLMLRTRLVAVAFCLAASAAVLSAQAKAPAPATKPALPPAVAAAFTKAYPTAIIKEFSAEKEDGTLQYEIESVDGTTKRDLVYLADGTLVVAEEEIPATAVPAAALTALKARYPKATVTRYEKLTRGTTTSYEFALKGAAVAEAEIAPDGTFISPKPVKTYEKVAEIAVGGPTTFDYLLADGPSKRLYVSHGTEVVVIDTEKNTIVGRIADTPGVHGIALAPALGRAFTTNGRENKVSIIDLKTLATLSKVETGANPDAVIYEPSQKRVWAFNHTGKSVTIIDAASGAVVASTPLSGVVEAGQADATIGKVFINIEDTSAVDVVDMLTFKVVANYKVAPAEEPTGMAVDPTTHHLFVGGGPNLVMMDTRTGAVLASVGICGGTDATFYDAALKTAFVSCRDGHIAVVAVIGNTLKVTETITTTPGARTMALDPLTHRLYVAGGDRAVADSFRVLVFAPGR